MFISESLRGELVGGGEMDSGHWIVRFFDYDLGLIDRTTHKLLRFGPARPGRPKATQNQNSVTHPSGP